MYYKNFLRSKIFWSSFPNNEFRCSCSHTHTHARSLHIMRQHKHTKNQTAHLKCVFCKFGTSFFVILLFKHEIIKHHFRRFPDQWISDNAMVLVRGTTHTHKENSLCKVFRLDKWQVCFEVYEFIQTEHQTMNDFSVWYCGCCWPLLLSLGDDVKLWNWLVGGWGAQCTNIWFVCLLRILIKWATSPQIGNMAMPFLPICFVVVFVLVNSKAPSVIFPSVIADIISISRSKQTLIRKVINKTVHNNLSLAFYVRYFFRRCMW